MRANVPVVDPRSHDREAGRIADASQEIGEGVSRKSEEKYLAARIEVEGLVQFVMLILGAEFQAMASLLPAESVAHSVGFFDSAVVGEGAGAEVEVVGHRNLRHTREEVAEWR